MKKKICICLGIVVTLLFTLFFCFVGSIKKIPITPEKFVSIMNSNGFQVQDDTNTLDADLKQVIIKLLNVSDFLSFAKCNNTKSARLLFDINYNRVKNENIKGGVNKFYNSKEFSNNHYQYKSYSTSNAYFVLIQVEDTLVQFGVNKESKSKTDDIIKEMGYDVGINTDILSAQMIIAGILAILLSLIYTILIFKNNKINSILALVPFVNFYFICKIADKNGWKMLLFLIPFFNFLYYFIIMYKLAKRYTDSKLICFGMGFLPLVLLPVIAFDEPKFEEKPKNVYEEILKEDGIE